MCAQTAGQTLPSPRCRMATLFLRPLTVGEVLDVSFGLYRSLFAPLVVIAAVSQVIPVLVSVYMGAAGGGAPRRAGGLIGRLAAIPILVTLLIGLGFILLVIPGIILLAGLVLSTVVAVIEGPPSH